MLHGATVRQRDVGFATSRCTMEHHDATGVTTPRQTVKASPHRHKWMLSHGAPADPSDPWNSHAAPVSPRQNCAFAPQVRAGYLGGRGEIELERINERRIE